MRKTSMIIAICGVVAMALTLYAQTRDLDPVMKEIGPTFTNLTKGMGDRSMPAADVAKDAEKLQKLFQEASAFMKSKSIQDGVGWANDAATAAGELVKAAKANDADAMKAASGNIGKQCKACHAVHREQLPDKTFKLKAP